MFNNTIFYIKNNTELLSMGYTHIAIITLILVVTSIFKRYNLFSFVPNVKIRFEMPVYALCLFLFILLNILDTLQPLSFVLYFVLVLPFIVFSGCNKQTKVFLMLTFNICYFVSTHLNPFLSIQKNEVWVYILGLVCVCVLLLWFGWQKVVLLVLFIAVLNFFVLGFGCLVSALDWSVAPLYVKFCIVALVCSLYIIFFLLYYMVTHVYYISSFKSLCRKVNAYPRLRIVLVSVCIVLLSLCLRNIYLYNIFVYQMLDYLDVLVLLNGTKNPHHDWMCGPGVKHLFGPHCRKMSSLLIYKQQQQAEMRQLYNELKALQEKKIEETDLDVLRVVKQNIYRHRFRHYACLFTKDNGIKVNTFVTHGSIVNGEATLPFIVSDQTERMTQIGVRVDKEYEEKYLSDITNMRDNTTDKLNAALRKNPEKYNENLASSVKVSEEAMSSAEQAKNQDILKAKKIIQKYNERNSDVD